MIDTDSVVTDNTRLPAPATTFEEKIELVINLATSNELYNSYSETAFNYQYGKNVISKMTKDNVKINKNDFIENISNIQNFIPNEKNKKIDKNGFENMKKIENNVVTILFQDENRQNRRKSLSDGYIITGAKYKNIKISEFWQTKIVVKSDVYSDSIYNSVFYSSSGSKTSNPSSSGIFAG